MVDPATSRHPPSALLTTKLRIPPVRPDLVSRQRLTEMLAAAGRRLTVVSAPAGFGKTTLLASWAQEISSSLGWLSLDEGDNDPARFWAYFAEALRTAAPELAAATPRSISTISVVQIATLMAPLLNSIATLPLHIELVLDDYHLITEKAIHAALDYLVDHSAPQFRLVIATRAEPPLSLSRLRARGELLEIGTDQLRFTPEEASAFLDRTMGLRLSAGEVTILETRTEGWVAGLQLAALSVSGKQDICAFVESFGGNQRYVLDFLADEVFSRQPPEVQRFLLMTSILERLSAPLCVAVTGDESSQSLLMSIEKANLFIVPLDDERRWYRYHHLFADFLRTRLAEGYPGLSAELHRRASLWLEGQGLTVEALEHSLAAGDYGTAARLLDGSAEEIVMRGELSSLSRWLQAIPEEVVRSLPRLCLARAWGFFGAGDLAGTHTWLDAADAAVGEGQQLQEVVAASAGVRSLMSIMEGQLEEAGQYALRAQESAPAGNAFLSSLAALALGFTHELSGDPAAASRAYIRATDSGRATGGSLVTGGALSQLGDLQITRGRLRYAARLYDQTLQLSDTGTGWPLITASAHLGLAKVYLEWNDLERASSHTQKGANLYSSWGSIGTIYSEIFQAETRQAMGDTAGAHESLDRAEAAGTSLSTIVGDVASAMVARIRLQMGEMEKVRSWARRVDQPQPSTDPLIRLYRDTVLGRVLAADGQLEKALEILGSLAEDAEGRDWWGVVIGALAGMAMIRQKMGDEAAALSCLRRAVALAEPEGYVRTFLLEGSGMYQLLSQLDEQLRNGSTEDAPSSVRPYVQRLLASFPREDREGGKSSPQAQTASPSFDSGDTISIPVSLSARELEIMRLLADGLSTHQLADRLVITDGTVKRHLHNIYGKLGATSRTQAIATARRRGLLRD